MFTEYDIRRLYEYLGQYAKHLILIDSEMSSGMLLEGAAKFLEYIEKTIEDEEIKNMD